MSWEVSTMPSKRSYFNPTLFRKHLSRFWPLWGGVSLVGAFLPLYMLLALVRGQVVEAADPNVFREGLYQAAAYFVPGFTCAYAILCVMAVWGYLYNPRAVELMHTLPVDRTCLFATNTLAVLAMTLTPFVVTGGLLCLIGLAWGFFDLVAVVNTVLAVLFCTALFVGLGTLCAMLTGHALALPAFYLLANFLAYLLELMATNLTHMFLIGVPIREDMGRLGFLSPVLEIYGSLSVYKERLAENEAAYHLRGLWVAALYALAGLAMLALSWHLYRRRHSESAGDVVAFRWLRPVFRYGVALLGGLALGLLLYRLMWEPLFQKGYYADRIPMGVCLFAGGLVGYYGAFMLLEKSLRVFGKKSLRGVGAVAAGAAALCLLASVDVFGLEKKIPAWEEIEGMSLVDRGVYSGPWSAGEDPDQAAALRALHQSIVRDRDYIRAYVPDFSEEEGKVFSHILYLNYWLKDGSTLSREYDLWLSRDRMEEEGTFENLLAAFYRDPAVRARDVTLPKGAELESVDVLCVYAENMYANTSERAGGDEAARRIYEALQEDAGAGHVPGKDPLRNLASWRPSEFYLRLNYRLFEKEIQGYRDQDMLVYLAPSMTNTLDALVELGYMTEGDVAQWKRDLEENAAWEDRALPDSGIWGTSE